MSNKYGIIIRLWETVHLPLPWTTINTYSSLRAKCWSRGGVCGQISRNERWSQLCFPGIIERFHVTLRRPYWYSCLFQNIKMATMLVFQTNPVGVEQFLLHRCWSREWKRSISNFTNNKCELWKNGTLRSFQKLQLQSVSIVFNFFYPFLLL